jgi:DNA-directed RNA polymerase subunit M
MFCPKCGSILIPKKEGGQTKFSCSCGYKSKTGAETIIKEKNKKEEKKLEIIEKDESETVMPIIKVKCPKCNNSEAHFWEVQTRAADEPATKFMKCTKCRHVWRDYS